MRRLRQRDNFPKPVGEVSIGFNDAIVGSPPPPTRHRSFENLPGHQESPHWGLPDIIIADVAEALLDANSWPSMSVIKKAYFDSEDGQVHYRSILTTQIPKKEPIVFMHMSASTGGQFEKLMHIYSALGHDCYAPDMPGFGGSYDLASQPESTSYYVEVFLKLFITLGLPKYHLVGHHSGACLATEMAADHPQHILSIFLIGTAIMTPEEQAAMNATANVPFNKPVPDGSHLIKTWAYLQGAGIGEDLDLMQQEALNHIRAWDGRNKIYTCVFKQDMWGMSSRISCPILTACAKDDILWPYVHYINEIRPEIPFQEILGGDFEPARDSEGISSIYTEFLAEICS